MMGPIIDESIIDYMMDIMNSGILMEENLEGDLESITLSMLIVGDWLDHIKSFEWSKNWTL